MSVLMLNLMLALVWAGLVGEISLRMLAFGFILGYALLWLLHPTGQRGHGYFLKFPRVLGFAVFYLYELVQANLMIAWDIVTPKPRFKPQIVDLPLDAETDLEITLLANLITMTPGTLSLDVSPDRKYLRIHAMYVDDADAFVKDLKETFEARVLDLLR